MRVKTEELLSEEYARERRALITDKAIMPEAGNPSKGRNRISMHRRW